jgi:hypothetical protein
VGHGRGTGHRPFSTSQLFAAVYPEAVKIAALIGSLHWRRLAAVDHLMRKLRVSQRFASRGRTYRTGPSASASRSCLSRVRSLVFARRIAAARTGAVTLPSPAGSPRLRRLIRVRCSSTGCQV